MKNIWMRSAALLLSLVLVLSGTGICVSAQEETTEHIPVPAETIIEVSHEPKTAEAERVTYGTVDAAAAVIRKGMKERQASIVVYVYDTYLYTEKNQGIYKIFEKAIAHTGVPDEGDYLYWNYGGYNASATYHPSGTGYNYKITYQMEYRTTKAQEAEVTAKVKQVLDILDLHDANDYDKIRGIYDYITSSVSYDNAATDDLRYTAYNALIKKSAVCQGYALLFYRLALELGIDNRIIVGTATGEDHAWNIVRHNDRYYNVDATWDAGYNTYAYFLKSQNNFLDHTRDGKFNTSEFHSKYPMAQENGEWDILVNAGASKKAELAVPNVGYGHVILIISRDGTTTPVATTARTGSGVSATFNKSVHIAVADNSKSFPDVPASHWAKDAVDYLTARGYMNGKLNGTFGDAEAIQRRTVAMMLWRIAGSPTVSGTLPFKDMKDPSDRYYMPVLWAYKNGIINGYTDNTFRGTDMLSRQHFAALLHRYAKWAGVKLDAVNNKKIESFGDYSLMNPRMYENMQWALNHGLILGRSDAQYDPVGLTSRSQMAVILFRFLQKVNK